MICGLKLLNYMHLYWLVAENSTIIDLYGDFLQKNEMKIITLSLFRAENIGFKRLFFVPFLTCRHAVLRVIFSLPPSGLKRKALPLRHNF